MYGQGSFALREFRGNIYFYMLIFVVAQTAYMLGGFELRYASTVVEPIETFEGWMWFLGGALPNLNFAVVLYFVVYVMTKQRVSSFLVYPSMIVSLITMGWALAVVGINLPVWVSCNDGGVNAPAHPECINRRYISSETLPDWTFMILVISSGLHAIAGALSSLFFYRAAAHIQGRFYVGDKIGQPQRDDREKMPAGSAVFLNNQPYPRSN